MHELFILKVGEMLASSLHELNEYAHLLQLITTIYHPYTNLDGYLVAVILLMGRENRFEFRECLTGLPLTQQARSLTRQDLPSV